jgi:hypothetical protein
VTVEIDDVDRAHANATVAGWPANVPFFRRAMNVNVAAKRVSVLRLHSAQPDDARYNWIASRRVDGDDFAGSAAVFKHSSGRRSIANLVRNFKFAERRPVTTWTIAQSEF